MSADLDKVTPDLPMLKMDCTPFDFCFTEASTKEKIQFVVGGVDGTVRLYTAKPTETWWKPPSYEEEDEDDADEDNESDDEDVGAFELDWSIPHADISIRGVERVGSKHIVSAARDGALGLIDIELAKMVLKAPGATDCGYEIVRAWDENCFLTGNEEGFVQCFDVRTKLEPVFSERDRKKDNKKAKKANMEEETPQIPLKNHGPGSSGLYFQEKWNNWDHADFITDMYCHHERHHVLFTASDAHLSVYDIRRGKFYAISDRNEDELNSVIVMKNGNNVMCGTERGPINIYSYDKFEYFNDRFNCQKGSMDCMVKIDEDLLYGAGDDGIIRFIEIFPNSVKGVIGIHRDSINNMELMLSDPDILGSCSNDGTVRFWDAGEMQLLGNNKLKGRYVGDTGEDLKPAVPVEEEEEDEDEDMEEDDAIWSWPTQADSDSLQKKKSGDRNIQSFENTSDDDMMEDDSDSDIVSDSSLDEGLDTEIRDKATVEHDLSESDDISDDSSDSEDSEDSEAENQPELKLSQRKALALRLQEVVKKRGLSLNTVAKNKMKADLALDVEANKTILNASYGKNLSKETPKATIPSEKEHLPKIAGKKKTKKTAKNALTTVSAAVAATSAVMAQIAKKQTADALAPPMKKMKRGNRFFDGL